MENTRTIARINDVAIQIIDNGEKRVPIKPICEALGIDYKTQHEKISNDEILSSVMGLSPTTGSDGKVYEMTTIPYKYVFGWLFTINPKNVNPDAKEKVMKYRMECYDVLFSHFADQSRFLDEKQVRLNEELDKLEQIKKNFKEAKDLLYEQNKVVDHVRHQSFEDWKMNERQFKIPFPTEEK